MSNDEAPITMADLKLITEELDRLLKSIALQQAYLDESLASLMTMSRDVTWFKNRLQEGWNRVGGDD